MVTNEKRNYLSMIGKLNDSFAENGWADGYADFDSDEENIIKQLYGKVDTKNLIEYTNAYLKGYEVGKFMSEEADEIYDEDGCEKEDLDIDSIFDYSDHIHQKILSMKNNKII